MTPMHPSIPAPMTLAAVLRHTLRLVADNPAWGSDAILGVADNQDQWAALWLRDADASAHPALAEHHRNVAAYLKDSARMLRELAPRFAR